MDNTVKETFIDKLIDELVDTKDEISELKIKETKLNVLASIILNNARLDYSGDSLRIENESAIFEYLRVIYPSYYKSKLDELKVEREAEIAKLKAAQEAKGKEEA